MVYFLKRVQVFHHFHIFALKSSPIAISIGFMSGSNKAGFEKYNSDTFINPSRGKINLKLRKF
jgi:hypothetical protein